MKTLQKGFPVSHTNKAKLCSIYMLFFFHNWKMLFPLIAIILYSTEVSSWERLCMSGPNLISILSPDLSIYTAGMCTLL